MSNNSKPHEELVGTKVQHDYSGDYGKITKTRDDIRGYIYFVEWDIMPERNDWYQLNVLERIEPPKTPSTTSKPVDSNIEQLFLDRILFIGNEIPDIDKHRNKFVLLGTPQDLMEDIQSLIDKQVLEGRIDEVKLMKNFVYAETKRGGSAVYGFNKAVGYFRFKADERIEALQTNNKEKK